MNDIKQREYKSDSELQRIFEHEFAVANIPFEEILRQDPYKAHLYQEFKTAPLKPCLWLYREQYFSQAEYEKIVDKADRMVPIHTGNIPIAAPTIPKTDGEIRLREIIEEFDKKRENLEPKFYCPDIWQTETLKTLSEIDEILNVFRMPEVDNRRVPTYVTNIKKWLEQIQSADLKEAILAEIIADNNNYNVEFFGGNLADWKRNKTEFNGLLLQESETIKNSQEAGSTNKTAKPVKTYKVKDDLKVKNYYDWLTDKEDIDCTWEQFRMIFSNDELPDNWTNFLPICWYKKGRFEKPHRGALGAVIKELTTITKRPKDSDKKIMNQFFVDELGHNIEPSLTQSDVSDSEHLMQQQDKRRYSFRNINK